MKFSTGDIGFMKKALRLAEKGRGFVSPNPMVGCVIVKNGREIASGFHKKFGGRHAEIEALSKCRNPEGATLYVTLEPCCHIGKTAACAERITGARLARVVVAMRDPNPKVIGEGVRKIRGAGVSVAVGCLQKEAEKLNEIFVKYMKTGTPFVAAKVAASLDGKIATRTGDSKWISSEKTRAYARALRDSYDAILVGIGTVLADDPILSGVARDPRRIILDSRLRIPLDAKVLRDSNVTVVTTDRAPTAKRERLQKRNIEVHMMKKIEIPSLLRFLGSRGISSVFVEGGGEVHGSFFDARAVDKLFWIVCPKIIGGREAKSAPQGLGAELVLDAVSLADVRSARIENDLLITARPVFPPR